MAAAETFETMGSLEPVEDSPESFVSRWRAHAADAEIFARPEGIPLIECRVAGEVIQVFERTGPYASRPGQAKLIVNPTTASVTVVPGAAEPSIETLGLSRVAVNGRVVARDGFTLLVDAGAPLVVTVRGQVPAELSEGDAVTFESDAPLHGFVVPPERSAHARREAVDDSI